MIPRRTVMTWHAGWRLLAVIAVAALPWHAMAGGVSSPDRAPLQSRDVNVDGRSLHFIVRPGERMAPVVLMEAGATLDSNEWSAVIDRLAPCTDATLVAYDRAGMGRSASLGTPYDIDQEVRRLHAALRKQRLSGPLLLVGHSFGGYLIQLYAHLFPKDVIGAVYVDANTVDGIGGPDGARTLIAPVIDGSTPFNDMRLARRYVDITTRMSRVPPPRGISVTVMTRGAEDQAGLTAAELRWRSGHAALAGASGGRLIFAPGAGHLIPNDRPDLVAAAIGDMLSGPIRRPARCPRH